MNTADDADPVLVDPASSDPSFRSEPELVAVGIVGPTAVGKSSLGVRLALEVGGEVVNCDSMQLYRGLDIGTAKTPIHLRQGVPHHLLDIWEIDHPANVAEYQRRARAIVSGIRDRGRIPIIVGGSGLYFRALIDDLRFPGTDPAIRRRWELELERVGSARLHGELAARDPGAAALILPTNGRRIVRALEVVELTGSFTAGLPHEAAYLSCRQIGLRAESALLDERIELRLESMFAEGFEAEVEGLRRRGLDAAPTASRALGYPQVSALLDGLLSPAEARAEISTLTRRFARRQQRWFRRDERVRWLDVGLHPDPLPAALATLAEWNIGP